MSQYLSSCLDRFKFETNKFGKSSWNFARMADEDKVMNIEESSFALMPVCVYSPIPLEVHSC